MKRKTCAFSARIYSAPNKYNSLQSIMHDHVSIDAFFSAEYCTRRNNSLGVANYLRTSAPKMTSLGVVDRKKDVISS